MTFIKIIHQKWNVLQNTLEKILQLMKNKKKVNINSYA